MDLIIHFPDLGTRPDSISLRLPRHLDDGMSSLSEALSRIELTQKEIPHITSEIRHWLNALEDRVIEARTALVMWKAYTELLSQESIGDFESKHRLDLARNYYAHDCSVRLATVNEHIAQLINKAIFLGFPEHQRQLPEKVMEKLSGTRLGTRFSELYLLECCRVVREELRHAFVHRSSPIIPRSIWDKVRTGNEQVLYLLSGQATIRVGDALRACQDMYEALNKEGFEVLELIAVEVPKRAEEQARERRK